MRQMFFASSRMRCCTYTLVCCARENAVTRRTTPLSSHACSSSLYKKSSSGRRHPKKSKASPSAVPLQRWNSRSWQNARIGATPLPGPTITTGTSGSCGRRNVLLRRQTRALRPSYAASAARLLLLLLLLLPPPPPPPPPPPLTSRERNVEHTPLWTRPSVLSSRTTLTVRPIRCGWLSALE